MTTDVRTRGAPAGRRDAVVGLITLAALRESVVGVRQGEVAQRLGVRQGNISKIEGRGDMKLSTLTAYIGALGGQLELRAHVDGKIFVLDIEETRGTKRPRRRESGSTPNA